MQLEKTMKPYLPGFVVEKMHCTEDDYPCCISMVKYKYLKGNDKPKSVQHFVDVLFALQKIHDAGFVHGDIRLCNLVFDDNGVHSYIIDFDMASKESDDNVYCEGYSDKEIIKKRHPEAFEKKKMERKHDRHSIAYLMDTVDRGSFSDVIKKISDTNTSLKEIANEIIQSTHFEQNSN